METNKKNKDKLEVTFNERSGLLFQLGDLLHKIGYTKTVVTVVLFVICYQLIVNPINLADIIQQFDKNKEEQYDREIQQRMTANSIIPTILESIRIQYNADRVCILEGHNGVSNLSGLSFLYFDMTFENINKLDIDKEYIADYYQRQRQSEYSDMLNLLERQGYIYYSNIDSILSVRNDKVLKKLKKNYVKSIMAFPLISNGKNYGILTITSDSIELNENQIRNNISGYIYNINNLLTVK